MSNGVNKGGGGSNGNSSPNVPVYVNIYDMVTKTFNRFQLFLHFFSFKSPFFTFLIDTDKFLIFD